MEQLSLDLDSLLPEQARTSCSSNPQKKKEKKASVKKKKAAGHKAETVPFCGFFSYKAEEYVYLGVLSSTKNWVADRILAIRSVQFTKKHKLSYEQVMENAVTISLSDPDLHNDFFIPIKYMTGYCTGYWVDTDTAELVIGHVKPEKISRSQPSYLSKRKVNAARR